MDYTKIEQKIRKLIEASKDDRFKDVGESTLELFRSIHTLRSQLLVAKHTLEHIEIAGDNKSSGLATGALSSMAQLEEV